MKFTNFSTKWISLLIAAALVLGGCGAQTEPETSSALASELPSSTQTEQAKEPVTELNVSMPENPHTLHPLCVTDEGMRNVLSLVFEPAIRLDYSDKPQPSVIENWSVDETGKIFTFALRKDVQFHNGQGTVTVDDLVFALDAICAMEVDVCPYAKYKGILVSYEKVSDTELKVVTTEKTGDIYYLMSFPVIPSSYYEGVSAETSKRPVGTGPYAVDAYSTEEGMTMTRNEDWWRRLPAVLTVNAIPADSEQDKIAGLQMGAYDCVTSTLMTANSYRAEGAIDVYSMVTQYYDALVPNMRNAALRSGEVRQAISLALDRREIISLGVLGEGVATSAPLRPDLWYLESMVGQANEYDATTAAKLLDEAGYVLNETDGYRYKGSSRLEINLIYTESTEIFYRKTVAEQIAKQLAEVGILVNVREKDASEYRSLLEAGTFDMALCSFYTKENNDISFLFVGESALNYGSYSSQKLNSLIQEARAAVTEDECVQAYTALNEELSTALPHIGLYFREHAALISAEIENVGKMRNLAAFADINEWN